MWSDESRARLVDFRKQMRQAGKTNAQIQRMRAPAIEIADVDDSQHRDGAIADQAIAALERLSQNEQPCFLATGFVRPHLPFVAPRKYWELYDREQIPLAPNPFFPKNMPSIAFGFKPPGGLYELRDYMDYADAPSPFESSLSVAQQRELKHGSYAAVAFVDAQFGRVLDRLKLLQLEEKTSWSRGATMVGS